MPSFTTTAAALITAALVSTTHTALTSATTNTTDELTVILNQGPTICPASETVIKGSKVEFHHTTTIDPTSLVGKHHQKIDSSRDRGIASSYPVGYNHIIKGLDDGLLGLCKHAKAYIIIPPHLGFGMQGNNRAKVAGGVTLRYDVEIIDVQPPAANDFVKIDTNNDWKLSKKEVRQYFADQDQAIDLEQLWSDEDMDDDGLISWEEFSGPKGDIEPLLTPQTPEEQNTKEALFEELDADKDGKISRVEHYKLYESIVDLNKDGNVTQEEVRLFSSSMQKLYPDGFLDSGLTDEEKGDFFTVVDKIVPGDVWETLDANGDGFLSRMEFLGVEDTDADTASSHQEEDERTEL